MGGGGVSTTFTSSKFYLSRCLFVCLFVCWPFWSVLAVGSPLNNGRQRRVSDDVIVSPGNGSHRYWLVNNETVPECLVL